MVLHKAAMDARIEQPAPERLVVVEGGGAARLVGAISLVGGVLMAASGGGAITLGFGIALALFGGAVATQRHRLSLDRATGIWSQGAEIFSVIPFNRSGLLAELGPVQITREIRSTSGEHTARSSSVCYPVRVPARTVERGEAELGFGTWDSPEEARAIAVPLAAFLERSVEDRSTADE